MDTHGSMTACVHKFEMISWILTTHSTLQLLQNVSLGCQFIHFILTSYIGIWINGYITLSTKGKNQYGLIHRLSPQILSQKVDSITLTFAILSIPTCTSNSIFLHVCEIINVHLNVCLWQCSHTKVRDFPYTCHKVFEIWKTWKQGRLDK